jgi:hypothetical protein
MTETEISKLRETVLQLWEGSKYLLLVREDLFEYVQNLKKELAEKIFDGSAKPHSFETIKQNAWIAFLEGFNGKDSEMAGLDKSKKAAVIALDKYLEKLENVNFKEDTQGEKTEKIDWEAGLAQLTFIFEILFKNEEIGCSMKQYKNRWALIAKHFTVKGEDITNKDLIAAFSGLKNSKTGKPRNHEMYEDLLHLTKKEAGFFPEE